LGCSAIGWVEVSHCTLQARYSWLVSVSHSQMKTILNISLTLSILNATGKRQFSALKRVKKLLMFYYISRAFDNFSNFSNRKFYTIRCELLNDVAQKNAYTGCTQKNIGVLKLFNSSYLRYTITNYTWDRRVTQRVFTTQTTSAQCGHHLLHGTQPPGSRIPPTLWSACLV
jgi:hypothetical protein